MNRTKLIKTGSIPIILATTGSARGPAINTRSTVTRSKVPMGDLQHRSNLQIEAIDIILGQIFNLRNKLNLHLLIKCYSCRYF